MGVEATWLAAREGADAAARSATEAGLLPALRHRLAASPAVVDVIDIGAGTGANQRWLRPRLGRPQRWTHLDHDPDILRHAYGIGPTTTVVGGLDRLPALIERADHPLITGSALLDVLTTDDLDQLCTTVIRTGTPALFSLSVTGEWRLDPPDPLDDSVRAAFDAHQQRAGRAGPDAPDLVRQRMITAQVPVQAAATPWLLTAAHDPALVRRFLVERVAAAIDQDARLAGPAHRWLTARLAAVPRKMVVGHADLLILP